MVIVGDKVQNLKYNTKSTEYKLPNPSKQAIDNLKIIVAPNGNNGHIELTSPLAQAPETHHFYQQNCPENSDTVANMIFTWPSTNHSS